MDHINLDSDCEIQGPDISTITIADSEADECECNASSDGEIEDGEVQNLEDTSADDSVQIVEDIKDVTTFTERQELFVVNFQNKENFKLLGHTIMNALQTALKQEANECIDFSITEANENSVCLKAFRKCIDFSISEASENSVCLKEFRMESPRLHAVETFSAEQPLVMQDEPSISLENTVSTPDPIRSDKEQSPDLSDLSALFMIDTEPAKKLDTIQVPSYKRTIKDVLNEESAQKRKKNSEDECIRVRPTSNCFNCGSTEHSIRDCQKPRNMKRINKAKKAFGTKTDRYHIDIEQRFAHLRPGTISDKLQSALGLKRGELPFFFYRMRVLGYPPGWLEDAKVAHSGITLFNSEGNPVLKPDEDEGEVDTLNHKYDVAKIVGFPGFNVNPGKSFYDDYKHHNVPPINELDLKEAFIKTLGDNIIKGYKRKKLVDQPAVNSPTAQNELTSLEVADMDIEDVGIKETDVSNVVFSRPMPPAEPRPEEIPPPPPTKPSVTLAVIELDTSNSTSEERPQSPTLEDLEAEQLKLLHELQSNTSTISEPAEDSLIDEVLALEQTQEEAVKTDEVNLGTDNPATSQPNAIQPSPPLTPTTPVLLHVSGKKVDIIKESHMGTPLLKFSPFDKLPDGENFKVGVSDVINFENLPDSTGKYEQMKVVIKKVRKIITKLHNEDD